MATFRYRALRVQARRTSSNREEGPILKGLSSLQVRLKGIRVLLAAGVAFLVLAGCAHPVTDFQFQNGTKAIAIHSDRSLPAGQQAQFLPIPQGKPIRPGKSQSPARRTALYTLATPQAPVSPTDDFFLEYTTSGGPLELHLHGLQPKGGAPTTTNTPLPVHGVARASDTIRFLAPIATGERVVSFQVTSPSPEARIHIQRAGFAPDAPEVSLSKGVLTVRKGIDLSGNGFIGTPPTQGMATITFRFPSLVAHLGEAQAQIILSYSYHPASGDIHLTAKDSSGHQQRYLIQPRPGSHHLYLYTASSGFTPSELELSTANPGFSLDAVSVHRFSTPQTTTSFDGTTKPIPADIGAILNYQPKWWRQKEYELFSWSLVPSVLIMEFESYAVQARFMKRFAFFIEKQGYVGKLWTNKQLAGLHGWNAHDYRPEDLARFYSTAAKESFKLNPEEIQLRKILLANSVITQNGNTYQPGKGALLTFAHEGPIWLRSLLLTHEGYHGIFFTHPEYRKAVFSIWDNAPIGERDVFRYIFLPYFRYDINDIYLVKNEFQAYLMEQPLDRTKQYFHDQLATEMRVMKIPPDSPLAQYAKDHPDMFYRSAEEVQKAVEKAVGVPAGDLVGLLPD